ncbi:MAG: AIPR family protein [Gemmatimonadaceae bacterium]
MAGLINLESSVGSAGSLDGRFFMKTFVIRANFARRMPDPTYQNEGVDRHILFVQANSFPAALAECLDPNARQPNTDRSVYREIRDSLKSNDGLFHLKNKGITVIARRVEKRGEDEYTLHLNDENGMMDGIVDGGHTAKIITEANADTTATFPEQYVKLEVLTNLRPDLIDVISGGLNTSVAVKLMSLKNLEGRFDWLKAVLASKPYGGRIAWSENDEGELTARDVVAMLSMFDIAKYPPKPDQTQPVKAYSSKEAVLKDYVADSSGVEKLAPIVTDILELHDHIAATSQGVWNDASGRFGGLKWVHNGRKVLPFNDRTSDAQPLPSALLPLLACFRQFVTVGEDDKYRWVSQDLNLNAIWDRHGLSLLRVTDEACDDAGRNPNKMGKSQRHWSSLLANSMINFRGS